MLTRTLLGALTLLSVACSTPAQTPPNTPASDATPTSDTTPSTDDTASPESAAALADIEAFFADPSMDTARPVVRFVTDSPAVVVVFRAPFTEVGADDDRSPLVLAAFAAGNARAQLRAGEKRDMPVEGVRGVLAVYAKWKESQPDLQLPALEDFARAEAEGTLDAAVEAAMADGA